MTVVPDVPDSTHVGRIDYQCPNAVVAIPQIETGQIKALAMLSATRPSILQTLPSAQEQG